MYTIWFSLPESNVVMKTEVPGSVNLEVAQRVWDLIARKFQMISSRP